LGGIFLSRRRLGFLDDPGFRRFGFWLGRRRWCGFKLGLGDDRFRNWRRRGFRFAKRLGSRRFRRRRRRFLDGFGFQGRFGSWRRY
jgi:hypothetical protein